jgi:putative component of membrane protein insertase Oxa1/YidC/SpoIIIJ protein YidD
MALIASVGYMEPWGKDEAFFHKSPIETVYTSPMSKVTDQLLIFFQKVISPIDGPRSHFRPTSSRYMQLSIRRYGFFQGYAMGMDRLLRENNELWVYPEIVIDNVMYKYDPAFINKNQ